MRTTALAVFAWLLAAGCSKGQQPPAIENKPASAPADAAGPTAADCDQLLAHLVDLEFAKAGANSLPQADVSAQKAQVNDAKRDEFRRTCIATPRDRVMCALAAADLDAVAKCDEPAR